MVYEINKYILKNYMNGRTALHNGDVDFKCKKIHIEPEKDKYVISLLVFYVLYIITGFIWWDSIVSSYEWLLFTFLIVGILLPILIYKNKTQKTANNIYLSDCIIKITNDSTGYDYKKSIPFEAIKNIRYDNGIEIELNNGQKLHYRICGNQARKRLGIEKIIGEFKRFKKMMRQNSSQTTDN